MPRTKSKEPPSPVGQERALEHSLLTLRRAWAGDIQEFSRFATSVVDPKPLVILDLNGQELFYLFDLKEGDAVVGSVRASASKTLGPAVLAVEIGPRRWDAAAATRRARSETVKRHKGASVKSTELVCYSYPKVGVRITFDLPRQPGLSVICDVASLEEVKSFGPDQKEGSTAWSYYEVFAAREAKERERLWELANAELEAARRATPRILDRELAARDLVRLKSEFALKSDLLATTFFSSRILQFSPRCTTHDCFALYAQQTDVYCAVATGQMILDFYRWYYTQDEIAAAMGTDGSGTSQAGQQTGYETLSGGCLDATLDTSADWAEAKAEIDANRPLKSGIPGHARACVGWMRQNIFLVGQAPRRWLRIYDPWPWSADICQGGNIVWEDWDSVTHTNFIYVRHT
jgi:hypothetical protein